jgi:molecular chaperone DnaJ
MIQVDPCPECRGRGAKKEARRYDVTVPPGTRPGAERVIEGAGEPGRFGGDAGRLRVTVNVRDDPFLVRDGDDILVEAPVSASELALGAVVVVPSVDGWLEVRLPPATTSGARLRLAGKGVPRASGGRGDQFV